jgi:AcrR family transcriptional regulator
MSRKSSPRSHRRHSLDGEASERARIVAAFMGLLVEQSIKKIDIRQIAAAGDTSLAQLRAEFDSTVIVLAAQVKEIGRLTLAADNIGSAERDRGLAMLLSFVLRTWLAGEEPDLTRAVSALDRASAWAIRRIPDPAPDSSAGLDRSRGKTRCQSRPSRAAVAEREREPRRMVPGLSLTPSRKSRTPSRRPAAGPNQLSKSCAAVSVSDCGSKSDVMICMGSAFL